MSSWTVDVNTPVGSSFLSAAKAIRLMFAVIMLFSKGNEYLNASRKTSMESLGIDRGDYR